MDTLSVHVTMSDGTDLAKSLLSTNLAVVDESPLEGSLLKLKSQVQSSGDSTVAATDTHHSNPPPLNQVSSHSNPSASLVSLLMPV